MNIDRIFSDAEEARVAQFVLRIVFRDQDEYHYNNVRMEGTIFNAHRRKLLNSQKITRDLLRSPTRKNTDEH